MQTLMKCRFMLHFIWVFTVCQSTRSGVPVYKGLNYIQPKNNDVSISNQNIRTGCLKETPYLDISFKRPEHRFEFIKIVNMPISLNVMYPKLNLNKRVFWTIWVWIIEGLYYTLSYDIASGSEIMPCNKIDKQLVANKFMGNIMTSITMFRT